MGNEVEQTQVDQQEGQEQTDKGGNEEQTQTYTQSDLDREVDRRLAKANEKFEKQLQEAKEAGKSEGQKLAAMSEKERKDAEIEARENKLAKREAELQKKELTSTVSDQLSEKGLPTSLAETLVELGDADIIHGAIDSIEKAIQQGINQGVNERLQSEGPQTGGSDLDGNKDPFAAATDKYSKTY
ncbi:DUF4355 domain-containing protein [Pediococcus pentosaceus]|uniref:DUF4355 domain-containing protein n=1 Tax=Pediococcus pentosaceus TaxID=1255 RepID=UPI003981AD95